MDVSYVGNEPACSQQQTKKKTKIPNLKTLNDIFKKHILLLSAKIIYYSISGI